MTISRTPAPGARRYGWQATRAERAATFPRARAALAAVGLRPGRLVLTDGGGSAATWLGDQVAVRVALTAHSTLSFEASVLRRARSIPVPEVIGIDPDGRWLVLERMPGTRLADLWPELSDDERRRAAYDVADLLATLHRVEPGDLIEPDFDRGLLPERVQVLRGRLHDAVGLGLPHDVAAALSSTVDTAVAALEMHGKVLCHRDVTAANVMCTSRVVSGLIDFEYAACDVPAAELDAFRLWEPDDPERVPDWACERYPALCSLDATTRRRLARLCRLLHGFLARAARGEPTEDRVRELALLAAA